jgi:hypothetical protein
MKRILLLIAAFCFAVFALLSFGVLTAHGRAGHATGWEGVGLAALAAAFL